jgi:hypothetical protein
MTIKLIVEYDQPEDVEAFFNVRCGVIQVGPVHPTS